MKRTSPKPPPSPDRLKEILHYDPLTGVFIWRIPRGSGGAVFRTKAGDVAGGKTTNGYVTIGVDGSPYLAHRLAWLYHYGEWPNEIDHKDRNRSNNSIDNLRPITHQKNCWKQSARENKSGFRGVAPKRRKWRAYITVNGKRRELGVFKTVTEAAEARVKAEAEHYVI